jgi:CheY-like chemotaxis protein
VFGWFGKSRGRESAGRRRKGTAHPHKHTFPLRRLCASIATPWPFVAMAPFGPARLALSFPAGPALPLRGDPDGKVPILGAQRPCAQGGLPTATEQRKLAVSSPNSSPQILLVEEDPTLLEITAFRLELLGYDVITRGSAEQALEWLREHLPAVIIVDQILPGISGVELINRISDDLRTSDIPVMMLATSSDLEDVKRAYSAGADEYLVIPYDPIVLEAKVERLASAVGQPA